MTDQMIAPPLTGSFSDALAWAGGPGARRQSRIHPLGRTDTGG
ncbi:gp168 [Mycobacterium phage Omega]|uniref:Uncharacterized protein n=1 Tax=Mycobacterium phage Omega TaxID=2907835 RepID=Q853Z8_BPMOM|nr:gp168 [Mycobacterium phage Omega]AAN12810.1 hypothetical protein PBI_OMEGA_168 [Mycobacterium phage Omega]